MELGQKHLVCDPTQKGRRSQVRRESSQTRWETTFVIVNGWSGCFGRGCHGCCRCCCWSFLSFSSSHTSRFPTFLQKSTQRCYTCIWWFSSASILFGTKCSLSSPAVTAFGRRSEVQFKGRLRPGKMLLVDFGEAQRAAQRCEERKSWFPSCHMHRCIKDNGLGMDSTSSRVNLNIGEVAIRALCVSDKTLVHRQPVESSIDLEENLQDPEQSKQPAKSEQVYSNTLVGLDLSLAQYESHSFPSVQSAQSAPRRGAPDRRFGVEDAICQEEAIWKLGREGKRVWRYSGQNYALLLLLGENEQPHRFQDFWECWVGRQKWHQCEYVLPPYVNTNGQEKP